MTIEHNGHTIKLEWHRDDDMGPPWKEHDGHGIVSEWTSRDKRAGEQVLCSDRHSRRYYDFAKTTKIAKRDGWGISDKEKSKLEKSLGRKMTRKEIVAEAVLRDFEYLRGWCDDEWEWSYYVVKIDGTNYHESCGGIDSPSQSEFEAEAIEMAKDWLDRELAETSDAACRDIATV